MLKVSPWKGVIRFGKRGKLNPRYIGPFKILAKVGRVHIVLELLRKLSRVHSTFHVSNVKKCLSDEPLAISLDEIHIDEKLNFIEEPVEIMDREVKRLKQSRIPIVKVCWNSRRGPEYTWEREDQMKKKYPHLFVNPDGLRERRSPVWGCDTARPQVPPISSNVSTAIVTASEKDPTTEVLTMPEDKTLYKKDLRSSRRVWGLQLAREVQEEFVYERSKHKRIRLKEMQRLLRIHAEENLKKLENDLGPLKEKTGVNPRNHNYQKIC
ncbi:hypothetical protein Tco_0409595 [Tanacetum coccineum]